MGTQDVHAFTVRPPHVSGSEPNLCDPRDAPWFILGMPHLNGRGLNVGWILREAGHQHMFALGDIPGCQPNGLKDVFGRRAIPGVVSCSITGRADEFKEDDVVELVLAQRPSALNGWRSVTQLRATTGAILTVEVLTVFASHGGASNHSIEPATMAPELVAERGTMVSRRSDQIRWMGSKARREAEAKLQPRSLSVRISSQLHFSGAGIACYASIHDLFVTAEVNSSPDQDAMQVETRRVHFFGNLDSGDMLDFSIRSFQRTSEGRDSLVMISDARRRADGLVVAVCESVYRR